MTIALIRQSQVELSNQDTFAVVDGWLISDSYTEDFHTLLDTYMRVHT